MQQQIEREEVERLEMEEKLKQELQAEKKAKYQELAGAGKLQDEDI